MSDLPRPTDVEIAAYIEQLEIAVCNPGAPCEVSLTTVFNVRGWAEEVQAGELRELIDPVTERVVDLPDLDIPPIGEAFKRNGDEFTITHDEPIT